MHNFNPGSQWADLASPVFQSWMEQNAVIELTKLMGTLRGNFEGLLQIEIVCSYEFMQYQMVFQEVWRARS